jgi:hypothetical protein
MWSGKEKEKGNARTHMEVKKGEKKQTSKPGYEIYETNACMKKQLHRRETPSVPVVHISVMMVLVNF